MFFVSKFLHDSYIKIVRRNPITGEEIEINLEAENEDKNDCDEVKNGCDEEVKGKSWCKSVNVSK